MKKRKKKPSQHRPIRKRAFLAAFRSTASVSKAAEAAKIDRTMHYRWLADDAKYRIAFAAAQEEAAQILEDEAVRRSVEGILEPIYYKGAAVGAVRRYSDGLMQFMLRGFRPEKYRENLNAKVEVTDKRFSGTLEDLLALYHQTQTQASE